MPYTIAFLKTNAFNHKADVIRDLAKAMEDSPFRCEMTDGYASVKHYMNAIYIRNVRLKEKKPYCGQHPGECAVGPTRKGHWLEWEDWVAFHTIVNDVLDKRRVPADVWSLPHDVKGKMWIRKGLRRRIKYEWKEDDSPFSMSRMAVGRNPIRVWNQGTDDQFAPEVK